MGVLVLIMMDSEGISETLVLICIACIYIYLHLLNIIFAHVILTE
jgi:hypothetical protein